MRVMHFRSWKNGRAYRDTILRIRFSADGSLITARFQNGIALTAMECHSGRVVQFPFVQGPRPTCHAYSWDAEYIVIGDVNGLARAYRLRDNSFIAELLSRTRSDGIRDVAFAPSREPGQQWLAVCGEEFCLWNPLTQHCFIAPDSGVYRSSAFDPEC